MEKLYTVRKTRPGADRGSDHELLIAKFTLKFYKVEKNTPKIRENHQKTNPQKMSFSLQGTGMPNQEIKKPGVTGKFGLGVQNEGKG